MSSRIVRDVDFLVIQFLHEERYKESAHRLEAVTNGESEDLDKYVSAFMKVEKNRISMKILLEIRKQKNDHPRAVEILRKDLKIFSQFNVEIFNKLAMLLSLKNFRANEEIFHYDGTRDRDSTHVVKMSRAFGVPKEASTSRPSGVPEEASTSRPSRVPEEASSSRPSGVPEEVPVKTLPVACPGQSQAHSLYTVDDLPKNVVGYLFPSSAVKSMDFHPVQQTVLLVGTNMGEVSIWDVSSGDRIILKKFEVWDIKACSVTLQASLAAEYTASVNRVMWSSDGSIFGVAYSKHIVHLYAYYGGDELSQHLEIDAHLGNVCDLAFSHPNMQLCVVTCGEDKTIKVWDANTGVMQYKFEGHEAPVYSICPHQRKDHQSIISATVDGKVKVWLYGTEGSHVDFDAPGHSCTTMAYSTDGTRLFSCGTNEDGKSHIVEWHDSFGVLKRTYTGLGKPSQEIVQFDTTKNHFLAVGDEFRIKFWDMENVNVLMSIDADGGLPASPRIRFSKEGVLLAVSTSDNGIKILANAEGVRLMLSVEKHAESTSKNNSDTQKIADAKSRIADESKMWKLIEINEQAQLRSLRLPEPILPVKILRLTYTNSGSSILALQYNALHKLWKWKQSDRNVSGKASTSILPELLQPSTNIIMTNELDGTEFGKAVPCFALSKNDCYVISASGGKISLFNIRTYKTMTTFMPPPPAVTCLAFHPQDNNVVVIEVKTILRGHQKRVTGLAFSSVLGVLVSSAADAQLRVWIVDRWEEQASKFLQKPGGGMLNSHGHTSVKFHQDETHVLVVHEACITVYEGSRLNYVNQWMAREPITDATYSCDSQSIFTCFVDGSVGIFTAAGLELRCRINRAAYLPSMSSLRAHPLAIAGHPSKANQFALGMSNGGVYVLEPLESEGQWCTSPDLDTSVGPTSKAPSE